MAQYSTGTVDLVNGDATVAGTGTTFTTEVSAGDGFTVVDSGVTYTVASITDDTHLELSSVYAGTTDTSLAYTIFRDFTSPDNIPELNKGDVETSTIWTRAVRKIQDLIIGIVSGGTTLTNVDIDSGDISSSVTLGSVAMSNYARTDVAETFDADVTLSSLTPRLYLVDSDGSTDAKYWDFQVSANQFALQTRTDGSVFGQNMIVGTRSGTTITSVEITSTTFTHNSDTVVTKVTPPAAATSTGTLGQIAEDDTYFYICTATNTWRRVAIASW